MNEFVALPQNSAKSAATTFLDRTLARFGTMAEVLIDQGREILGTFEEFCTMAFIDHRTTSRDDSEAGAWLTTKRGLRKY